MTSASLSVASDPWLSALSSRCQRLAGLAVYGGASLTASIAELSEGMPVDLAPGGRLATRNLLTTTLARVSQATGSAGRPDVLSIFFDWASCDATSPTWHRDALRFVDRCAAALTLDGAMAPSWLGDVGVVRAIQMIESQYANADLSLRSVASHARLSVWHLARLLKRATGLGFSALLHRARIAAARVLLDQGVLSMKEIAATVGYRSSSQFGRHFKRLVGTTPARYRASRSTRIA